MKDRKYFGENGALDIGSVFITKLFFFNISTRLQDTAEWEKWKYTRKSRELRENRIKMNQKATKLRRGQIQ